MKIRLDQIDEPFVWQETLKVPGSELDLSELVEIGAIECRGKVSLMAESYLLRAELSYEHRLRCMRCLKPVTLPSSSDLDLILEIGSQGPPKGSKWKEPPKGGKRSESPVQELELEQDDLGLLHLEDAVLDTRPLIIEQIQLNIPMKLLCKEDCAGLCASCGTDLNAGPCDCDTVADPRWQALAALKRSK